MAPVCVLVGAPGSGKTTVGLALAELLGVEFRDTDLDIVRQAGKPISEIFIDEGEDHFRTLERAAVAAGLASCGGVLALGGGAVLAEENRAALVGHAVVYLSVDLSDAVKRVGLGAGRPLLAINPRATLKYLLDQRRPLYAEVATATVVTDGRSPAEIAAEIVALLKR
ncbi:shikimate kinase [Micromonospora peucetia]|uniref:Shikimate kinase n=1 Tax=Micromonospora peucetia TaxID=47871 RepID=A0A1C6W5B8_9ACTN|nr:shikimate kinase [Micromonospora peucetia]MCX4385388.1 shikimate kinase [Micromonospora peucetia]WSA32789.1 shikimate kinase [Micromonospora peucetia]SCL73785.1 shikimate kinase [Micromonospora peucetia]